MNQDTQTDVKTPEIGDKVLYVMEGGRSEGRIRPAFIVEIFETTGLSADNSPPKFMVNLQVLTDGSNDGLDSSQGGTIWKGSRYFSPDKMPGTWHYPATATSQQIDLTTSQETEAPKLDLATTSRGGIY